MATLHKIRWSPDWCSCSVVYEYDRDLSPENITFTGSEIVRKCPAHQNITDPAELYTVLHSETTLKERSRQSVADSLSDQLVTIDPQTQSRSLDPTKVDITFDFQGTNPTLRNVDAHFRILDSRLRLDATKRTSFKTALRTRITSDPTLDTQAQTRIAIYDDDDATRERLNR